MIPGARTPDGAIYIWTSTPAGPQLAQGGISVRDDGSVFVMNGTGPNSSGGHMITGAGQLCIAPGGAIDHYVNGLPVTVDGRLVTQLNQVPAPSDAWVGGIRVGPLGGVYTVDTTPPVSGFSSGFDAGFQ